jgi:oxygen-independent coproporphyrinogen III oxidase
MGNVREKLAKKYSGYAYMYAEYPNKNFWDKTFSSRELKVALKELPAYSPEEPLMLYVHNPFCPKACSYCSCSKEISTDYSRVKRHTTSLFREMDMFSDFFQTEGITPNVRQIHLGGGSPTYLKNEDFDLLVQRLEGISPVGELDEFAIEIDPRQTDGERMLFYRSRGINRVSFGVQEFNPQVQRAINRIQPYELLANVLTPSVRRHFESVSFDILYGLPHQKLETFRETIDKVIDLDPDRVVLLSFNYSPETVKNQRTIKTEDLPSNELKNELFLESSRQLLEAGYVRVGLEHFVKPVDKIALAWQTKDLNWNMGGYNVGKANKIIGIGSSSASRITDDFYFQNMIDLKDYEESCDKGEFPILRGYRLTKEDKIRRDIVNRLRSNFELDFGTISEDHGIDFDSHFSEEISRLKPFIQDGLITFEGNKIKVTEEGLPFVSFVCMNFDEYHQKKFRFY